MRALFTLIPAVGSLHPLVPVARVMANAGHKVHFACAASFRPTVEDHGFATSPAGLDFLFSQPDYFPKLVAEAGVPVPNMAQLTGHARHAWVTENLFIRAAAHRMLPDVLALMEEWRPDLLVRESSEYSGCVAAEAAGIPHVSVAAAADAALDLRHITAAPLELLRSAAGLPPDPAAEMVYRHLHVSCMPAGFFGSDARFPATTRFLRHADAPRPGQSVPGWWDHRPDQPTALVSLGTIFFRTPGLYEAIVTGLSELQLTVAVGIGHDNDTPPIPRPTPHVYAEPTLPIPALLRQCDLFVTHGGFNSVKEAVTAGTPMLVVPIASDQHYAADRAEALGIARVVRPDERTPDRIREEAAVLLGDPRYRTRAAAFAAEMAALPPLEQVADLVDELV